MTESRYRQHTPAVFAVAAIVLLLAGCTQNIWEEPQVVLAEGELRVLSRFEQRIYTKNALRICHNACPADSTRVRYWLHTYSLSGPPTADWNSQLLDESHTDDTQQSEWRTTRLWLLADGYAVQQSKAPYGAPQRCGFVDRMLTLKDVQPRWNACDEFGFGDYSWRSNDGQRELRVHAESGSVRWTQEWSAQSFRLAHSSWQPKFRAPVASVLTKACSADRHSGDADKATGAVLRMLANDAGRLVEYLSKPPGVDGDELPGTLAIHDFSADRTECYVLSAPPGAETTRLERVHFTAEGAATILLRRRLSHGRFGYAVISPDNSLLAVDDGYLADDSGDTAADPNHATRLLAWDPERGLLVHQQNGASFGNESLRLLVSDYRKQQHRGLQLEMRQ